MKRFFSHLPGLGRGVGGGQLAGEREHQGDGMLGGGDRIAERRVHHDHAARGRGRDVDIVDADAGAADHLEVGRGVEQLGGDLGRRADGEAVIVADDRLQLVLRRGRASRRPRRRWRGRSRRLSGPSGRRSGLWASCSSSVIPAKAGISWGENLGAFRPEAPAFAGVTVRSRSPRDRPSRARGRAPRCRRCRRWRRTRCAGPAGRRDSRRCRRPRLRARAAHRSS